MKQNASARSKKRRTISVLFLIVAAILTVSLLAGCAESVTGGEGSARKSGSVPGLVLLNDDDPPVQVTYRLTRVYNNGEANDVSFDAVSTLTSAMLAEPPVRLQGHTFEGWYYTVSLTGVKAAVGDRLTADTTIYAKWVSSEAIRISTAEELDDVRLAPYSSYVLVNNIDLSDWEGEKDAEGNDKGWEPIGGFAEGEEFSGTFDGNGYVISGMRISYLEEDEEFNYLPVGLFGKVTGTVSGVRLVNYSIELPGDQSRFYIGGIVGWLERGTINDCSAVGTFINPEFEYEEGIWDELFGSYAEPSTGIYVGGIVGYVEGGTVTSVSSEGSINSVSNEENNYFGGIAGVVDYYTEETETETVSVRPRVSNAVSTVSVYGRYAGGLIGYNNGTVTASYATGTAGASRAYPGIAGGLVAYNYSRGIIQRCYATGATDARTAGGLVGVNIFDFEEAIGGTISDAYATGNVFASEYAGGLIGRAVSNLPYGGRSDFSDTVFDDSYEHETGDTTFFMVQNCLAYGSVTANAGQTIYTDYEGNETTANAYHAVFAGSVIGQAYELYIRYTVGFGNVEAISYRDSADQVVGEETYEYNVAYGDNFVGHSTGLTSSDDCYGIYVVKGLSVTRNGEPYLKDASGNGYNTVPESSLTGEVSFYTADLNFNTAYWNFSALSSGGRPTLMI